MKKIISSLDVGTNTIKLIVGEIFKNDLNILACIEVKSKGIKKGIIVDPESTFESLKELFARAEEIIGIKIKRVIACVPSYYAEFIETSGYTLITREEKIINGDDIIRALQACVYNKVSPNKELISIMPTKFIIDESDVVDDPKRMPGTKLTIESLLGVCPKKNAYVLLSLLDNLGIYTTDLCFGGLADYNEFKTKELNQKLGAIINIGTEITEISIIDSGTLIATESLPLGGKSIDKDIVYIYNIYRKDARFLKEKFGYAHKKCANSNIIEEVISKDGTLIKINQYEFSEVIYARVKEILELSKKQINLLTNQEVCYIIITGGSSELKDFDKVCDEVIGKNYIIPQISEFGVRHNKYSKALGIIKYYNDKIQFREKNPSTFDEEEEKELFSTKKKINNNILGKIYGYFFDN